MRPKFSKIQKLNFLILFFLLFATVGYLKQINNQAALSFKAQSLERERTEKTNLIKKLNWDLDEQSSISQIQQRALNLDLGKAGEVSFLDAKIGSVARGN